VSGEDVSDFDIAEWYLRHDGARWGPLDVMDIRTLAERGRVRASTLVLRDGESVWTRLEDAIPDWQPISQTAEQPEQLAPPDPVLHTFSARIWVSLLEECLLAWAGYALAAALLRYWDWEAVALASVGTSLGLLLSDRRERLEVTRKVVRLVSAGRVARELRVDDIDRNLRPTGALGYITGRRTIRSQSGRRLTFNRRAFRDGDYAELMRLLQLNQD
jgi:hypothetical protein